MSELLNDVIDYIVDGALATAKDVDIFKDHSPETPDDCTIVYEYTGTAPAQFTDVSVRSVQIVARSKSNAIAKEQAWAIYNLMHKEDLFITLGDRKCLIQMRNTPIKIGVDTLNRVMFAFNTGITTHKDY